MTRIWLLLLALFISDDEPVDIPDPQRFVPVVEEIEGDRRG